MPSIRTGHLDQLIYIESATETQDSFGQPVKTWATFKKAFAMVAPLKARERFRGDRFVFEDFQFFTIRWIAGITPLMRIRHNDGNGDRYFNIRNINEVAEGRRRWIEMTAEAQE